MEGFLIHVADGQSRNVAGKLARRAKVVTLSPSLCAVRTELPAQTLLSELTAGMPKGSPLLIVRTNGAYFQGDSQISDAAKLLG